MKCFVVSAFVTLVLFSFSSTAEVNFVTYVKRNIQTLKATSSPSQVSAFGSKQMYRNLASDQPAASANSVLTPDPSKPPVSPTATVATTPSTEAPKAVTPAAAPSSADAAEAAAASVTPNSERTPSSEEGPNR